METYVGGLLVVVYVVYVSGQAEVGDFHDVVVRHQNIRGRQVSVDTLMTPNTDVSKDQSLLSGVQVSATLFKCVCWCMWIGRAHV